MYDTVQASEVGNELECHACAFVLCSCLAWSRSRLYLASMCSFVARIAMLVPATSVQVWLAAPPNSPSLPTLQLGRRQRPIRLRFVALTEVGSSKMIPVVVTPTSIFPKSSHSEAVIVFKLETPAGLLRRSHGHSGSSSIRNHKDHL